MILEHFKALTKIPHCSEDATQLLAFLIDFAKACSYKVEVDKAQNIFISKGEPNLCLQAHYDMVCMGKAPNIETYIKEGWMRAKDSSLGADNGMAIAMMMELMEGRKDLEFLLTADEEIGLIGANALEFTLKSKYMLNLDSEDEAEVYIGCAGGVDITAFKQDTYNEGEGLCYEVSVKSLVGGHSGVDIDKGIASAIKVLGTYLSEKNITQLASIYAGERRNSISANAVAIIRSIEPLESKGDVSVRVLNEKPKILSQGAKIIALINAFRHGVHHFNDDLGIPDVSINLAIITADEKGGIKIETSARAMDSEGLEKLSQETLAFFDSYGFDTVLEDKYPAWKPDISDFTKRVNECMKKEFGKSKFMAIHAGLECGVIAKKYPQIKFASIGPTIRYPHSTREEVNIKSVERTYRVLESVIEET